MEKISLSHSWPHEQLFGGMGAPAVDGIVSGSGDVTDPGYDYGDQAAFESVASGDASPGNYEALAVSREERGDGRMHGTPLFPVAGHPDRFVSASPRSSAREDLTTFDPDHGSIEQFSITHANWGFIEVDSRRSGVAWNVVVRCSEADTRQRLKSREPEFADMLKRDFGVSLELDVQAAARP